MAQTTRLHVCRTLPIQCIGDTVLLKSHFMYDSFILYTVGPQGTFRNASGGSTVDDCPPCPGGFYCPEEMEPIACQAGTYCPPGSAVETICPRSFYCIANSATPMSCPQQYYCPEGSKTPSECPASHYCPLGYIGRKNASISLGDFASVIRACDKCPAGSIGIDPLRLGCDVCMSTYWCAIGSGVDSTSKEYTCSLDSYNYIDGARVLPDGSLLQTRYYCQCPAGYYCPGASPFPVACPIGTYNPLVGQFNETACLPCAKDTYNYETGQAGCRPCGSSAISDVMASTCTCLGLHRTFSRVDGQCICEPGYIYYDEVDQKTSEKDSAIPCQPSVLPRCQASEILFGDGTCVDPGNHAAAVVKCSSFCGTSDNVQGINANLGVCECSSYETADEVCNATCQAVLPQLFCAQSGFILKDPDGAIIAEYPTCSGSLGTCTSGALVTPVSFGSSAITGDFATKAYYDQLCGVASAPSRRRTTISGSFLAVTNPFVCVTEGDVITFNLDPLNRDSFPVYLKDHLLNTNMHFDYGGFRNLKNLIQTTNTTIFSFSFQFTEPGFYVIGDNAFPSLYMYVDVVAEGKVCDGTYQPPSSSTLINAGAAKSNVVVQPNWIVIGIILGVTALIVILMIAAVFFVKEKNPQYHSYKPTYSTVDGLSSEVLPWKTGNSPKSLNEEYLLENFSVRTLYDKLEDQSLYVTAQLAKQTQETKSLFDQLASQTDELKSLMQTIAVPQPDSANPAAAVVPTQEGIVQASQPAPVEKDNTQMRLRMAKELELMNEVQALLKKSSVDRPVTHAASSKTKKGGKAAKKQEARDSKRKHHEAVSQKFLQAVSSTDDDLSAQLNALFAENADEIASDGGFIQLEQILDGSREAEAERIEGIRRELQAAIDPSNPSAPQIEQQVIAIQILQAELEQQASLEKAKLIEETTAALEFETEQILNEALTSMVESGAISEADRVRALKIALESKRSLTDKRTALENKKKALLKQRMAERKQKSTQKQDAQIFEEMNQQIAELEQSPSFQKLQVPEQKEGERKTVRDKIMARQRTRQGVQEQLAEKEEAKIAEQLAQATAETERENVKKDVTQMAQAISRDLKLSQEASIALATELIGQASKAVDKHEAMRKEKEDALLSRLQAMKREKQRALVQHSADASIGQDLVIPIIIVDEESKRAEQSLISNQERITAEIRRRHEQEAQELARSVEAEIERQKKATDEQLRLKKEQLLAEHQNRLQAELASRKDLTGAQAEKLLAEHEKEMKDLSERFDGERAKTSQALQEKLAERKRKKQEELRLKQESELQKEVINQKVELLELQRDQSQAFEKEAMLMAIQQNPENVTEAIQAVLEQRHNREKAALINRFESELQLATQNNLIQLQATLTQKQDALSQQQASEIAAIEANAGRYTEDQMDELRVQCQSKHATENRALLDWFDGQKKISERRIGTDMQLKFNTEQLALSENHYQEYIEALKELSPEHAKSESGKQAQAAAKELEEMRRKLDVQRQKREQEALLERKQFEEEQQRKIEDDLAAYERQLAMETEKEKQRAERELELLNKKKADIIQERKQKQKENYDRIKSSEANPDERDKILQQHEQEVQRLENALESEKLRQRSYLQERLAQRQEKKRKVKLQEITAMAEAARRKQEEDERVKTEQLARAETSALQVSFSQTVGSIRKPPVVSVQQQDEEEEEEEEEEQVSEMPSQLNVTSTSTEPAGISEQDIISVLQASGLLERLIGIEQSLKDNAEQHHGVAPPVPVPVTEQPVQSSQASSVPSSTTALPTYRDTQDSELKCSGSVPVPVDVSVLDARTFVAYRFGVFITDLLTQNQFERVNLLLASMLPARNPRLQNVYEGNAFQNSIYFDQSSCSLFVRVERLQSVGDFILVLVHSMAHITAKNMSNDSDPNFIREFHRGIRICCEDLFFSRSQIKQEPPAGLAASMSKAQSSEGKSRVVDEFLQSHNDASLNLDDIKTRINKYVSTNDRRILGGKLNLVDEETAQSTLMVQNRMNVLNAELKTLQAESSASQLASLRQLDAKNLASHAALLNRSDDLRQKLELNKLNLDNATMEVRKASQRIQDLKDQLKQGSVASDDPHWLQLNQDLTEKLVVQQKLEIEQVALTQRRSALDSLQ